jgi:hypothetical protein
VTLCGRLDKINYARAIKYHTYKYVRWQEEETCTTKYWAQCKDEEKRRWAGTIKCRDKQKCNKNDCNKRGLEKWQQWQSCIT